MFRERVSYIHILFLISHAVRKIIGYVCPGTPAIFILNHGLAPLIIGRFLLGLDAHSTQKVTGCVRYSPCIKVFLLGLGFAPSFWLECFRLNVKIWAAVHYVRLRHGSAVCGVLACTDMYCMYNSCFITFILLNFLAGCPSYRRDVYVMYVRVYFISPR